MLEISCRRAKRRENLSSRPIPGISGILEIPKWWRDPGPRGPRRLEWSMRKVLLALVSLLLLRLSSRSHERSPVGTRSGLRNRESPSSTSDRPLSLQKRRRHLHESGGRFPKKRKSDGDAIPDGTSGQEPRTSSELGVESSDEPETEEPKRPQKQAPKVQSAIYANHKFSSSFDISHTINLLLIGM